VEARRRWRWRRPKRKVRGRAGAVADRRGWRLEEVEAALAPPATTELMKQLLNGFNDLKAHQIETREALKEIRMRTEAVEAQAAGLERQASSAPPTPTAEMVDLNPLAGQAHPTTTLAGIDIGNGSRDHCSALLFRGDGPGILGVPESALGTGTIQTRIPTPLYFRDVPRDDHVVHHEETMRAPGPKIEFPKFDGENPKL
jgi:hypothetical protein